MIVNGDPPLQPIQPASAPRNIDPPPEADEGPTEDPDKGTTVTEPTDELTERRTIAPPTANRHPHRRRRAADIRICRNEKEDAGDAGSKSKQTVNAARTSWDKCGPHRTQHKAYTS